jgi:tetratricopeptide (TPR) repeat protein
MLSMVAGLVLWSGPLRADALDDCEQLKEPARAIRACSRLISVIPDTAALYTKRGIAYFDNGQIELAIADYTRAIALDPRFTEAHYHRGHAFLSKEAYARAIADFSQALSRNPKHALSRNGRAWAAFKLGGDLASALDDANQAIAADATFAAAYDTRGHIYEALGRHDEAVAAFRKALALEPQNPSAHLTRQGLLRLGVIP